MYRTGILAVFLLLTACTITIDPKTVTVTANPSVVRPGGTVTLTASTNFQTTSEILWRLGSNDTRDPSTVFSSRTGLTVTYTAPMQDGNYTVTAETVDEVTLRGSAQIVVDSFLGAEVVSPTDPDTSVKSGRLASGDTQLLAIDVSNAQAAAGQAIFFELDRNIDLSVFNADRSIYASSNSPAFFAAGSGGLGAAVLTTEAISINQVCRGACVIRDVSAGTYYLRIRNQSNAAVDYKLFVYVEDYKDQGEPGNGNETTAISLSDVDLGAIESIGDVDFYKVTRGGTLEFRSNSVLELRAEVRGEDGTTVTLSPGDRYARLIAGDVIRVFELTGTRAAASAASSYTLEILSP